MAKSTHTSVQAAGSKRAKAERPASGGKAAAPPKREDDLSSVRALRAAERRAAIVEAALDEFTARGFAATRLEDVAKRAGVAKGTIYLYFADKETLFQELLRFSLLPLIGELGAPPRPGISARAMLESFVEVFVREVTETKRADLLRLLISEGKRFPSLAEFHYREVVVHGIAAMRRVIAYGLERGEIRNKALLDYPQLLMAPAMLTVVWQGLFNRFAPLDARALLRTHIDIMFDKGDAP
ncbi:TetR/AcrR family transcriptional regulator [Rhodopseudomonas palustris]|uniref:TetR/AcrR family transcriptional regulator n=1 Tax=Rhodopseudomonas palustris TaxID=1076 RepID=A0A418VH63_RHOPL|nr:TetR/AcrR family transcriptional regulator [Rhodopseudomonas palustris]